MQYKGLLFGAFLLAGAGAAQSFVQKQSASAAPPNGTGTPLCPAQLAAGTGSLRCICPAEATAIGSVWGSDVYTDDSAICRAALHAGVIGADGGEVHVLEAPGRSSYPAVNRNSVASSPFSSWQRSIVFSRDKADDVEACPANARGLEVGTALRCGCTSLASSNGNVWGSGPYTADSAICRAAVHAGAATGNGYETVSVLITPGRAGYSSSSSNGVSASSWAAYGTSFEFRQPE